jgi:hypothetical protein
MNKKQAARCALSTLALGISWGLFKHAEAGDKTLKLKISKLTSKDPKGMSKVFAAKITVFGVPIYATKAVPKKKHRHAAIVMAQYLDNDSDGKPDNKKVVKKMLEKGAGMVMFATERDARRGFDKLESSVPEHVRDRLHLQDLYGSETILPGSNSDRFDATLEEVLHLITTAGYAEAYPKIFGCEPGTSLARAMDKARGGHFRRIPRSYPKGAWYTYDDETCDYGCQMTEYIYWGLTSILGAQKKNARLRDIQQEWTLNTREKVKRTDKALYKLLTEAKYKFPKRLPTGVVKASKEK